MTGDYSQDMNKMEILNHDYEMAIYNRDVKRNIRRITKTIKKNNTKDEDDERKFKERKERGVALWRCRCHSMIIYY